MFYVNGPGVAKKPLPKKRLKCQAELYLDSLRMDGYNKASRKERFKEYSKSKLQEPTSHNNWRHVSIVNKTTKENSIRITAINGFYREFGKAFEISLRSGDPSFLLAELKILIDLLRDPFFEGARFPSHTEIVNKLNHVHPLRAIAICSSCDKYTEMSSSFRLGRRVYCRECYELLRDCERCGSKCETLHRVIAVTGTQLKWCDTCMGRAFHWNDGHFHENPMPITGVGTYHSSQQHMRQIGRTIEGLCSVGFELEFVPIGFTKEKRDAISGKLRKLGEIIAGVEEDGSIRHLSGAEIVSNYGAIDSVLSGVDEISAVLNGKAISHSTNCCGLHVSLGRKTIDQWTLAKFVAFWNSSRNRDFLKSFCRRWESGYCKPKSEKGKLTDQMSEMRVPEHIINCHDRRELVNTQNRSRIEVRAFRGTTNAETIKRCISLCVWLMAYCSESEDRKMRYSGFLDWCKTARRTRGNDVFTPACITEFAEMKGFIGQDNPRRIILSK